MTDMLFLRNKQFFEEFIQIPLEDYFELPLNVQRRLWKSFKKEGKPTWDQIWNKWKSERKSEKERKEELKKYERDWDVDAENPFLSG